MLRWLSLLLLVTLLACSEPSALAPEPDETAAGTPAPRIVFRIRPGRFLCGLPPDERGRTCRFIPEDGAAP